MAAYAGDVDASSAWDRLKENKDSLLVDVRTAAEWTFVGVPNLGTLNKDVILAEWQQYPQMNVDTAFTTKVEQAVLAQGGSRATEIYFLCRSGVRSQSAAAALTSIGFENCFNVTGGFEGPHDDENHRGTIDGWKAKELPWIQK